MHTWWPQQVPPLPACINPIGDEHIVLFESKRLVTTLYQLQDDSFGEQVCYLAYWFFVFKQIDDSLSVCEYMTTNWLVTNPVIKFWITPLIALQVNIIRSRKDNEIIEILQKRLLQQDETLESITANIADLNKLVAASKFPSIPNYEESTRLSCIIQLFHLVELLHCHNAQAKPFEMQRDSELNILRLLLRI